MAENEFLIERGIPDEQMKIVPSPQGYDLIIHHAPELPPIRIATVYRNPNISDTNLFNMAAAMASSFSLMHCLSEMIDELEPDGWDENGGTDDERLQAQFWAYVQRTWLTALNSDIPQWLTPPSTQD